MRRAARTIGGSRFGGRSGFTLLEIVLVVTVLAVVAGMTWPAMMSYVREQRLREAVVDVRNELAGARIKAIESSLVYQFRFEPGGRWYAVLSYDRPDVGNAQLASGVAGLAGQRAVASVLAQLPQTIKFNGNGVATEQIPKEWMALLPQSAGVGQVAWSPPVLFQVDGTADNATILVQDERGNGLELIVRGLTGATSIGPIRQGVPQ